MSLVVVIFKLRYDPKIGLVAPSYSYGNESTMINPSIDGDQDEIIFEWDQSFGSYMFGIDSPELALANLIAIAKSKTAGGFIPGLSGAGGTLKTRSTTQPPVTSKALAEIAKR